MFSILFWNCNSIMQTTHNFQLNTLLDSKQAPDIVCLAETKCDEKKSIFLTSSNYILENFPYRSNSSGIAFLVKKGIEYIHCSNFSLSSHDKNNLETSSMIEWIKIKSSAFSFYLGLIYKHPNCNSDDWKILLKSINQVVALNEKFLLVGDYNSRSFFLERYS